MPSLYQPPVPHALLIPPTGYPAGAPFVGFQSTDTVISAAQILHMATVPVQLVPAPTLAIFPLPPQYVCVQRVIVRYNFGGTPYTGTTGALQILVGTAALTQTFVTLNTANVGSLTSTIEDLPQGLLNVGTKALPQSAMESQAVTVKFSGSNPTGGNGSLHITVYYTTEPVT
jgi:hypothetical protein